MGNIKDSNLSFACNRHLSLTLALCYLLHYISLLKWHKYVGKSFQSFKVPDQKSWRYLQDSNLPYCLLYCATFLLLFICLNIFVQIVSDTTKSAQDSSLFFFLIYYGRQAFNYRYRIFCIG